MTERPIARSGIHLLLPGELVFNTLTPGFSFLVLDVSPKEWICLWYDPFADRSGVRRFSGEAWVEEEHWRKL